MIDSGRSGEGATAHVTAFAPGRLNLIGEFTDYNDGLALPLAIAEGITVRAAATGDGCIEAHALDLSESDRFEADAPSRTASGWRAFVHGVVAELAAAGVRSAGARVEITGTVPRGAGLSSSAALEVATSMALVALAGEELPDGRDLARICSRVENEWVGARTGLLDQLASIFGQADAALRIDFRSLAIEPVPLRLEGWRLATLDSGERHANAESGYNQRRLECTRACAALGVASLRDAEPSMLGALDSPLAERARHVLDENRRVDQAVAALRAGNLEEMASLLNASHASLRDLYEVSTPAVEATVAAFRAAGAAGARVVGGGFGGHVLGLMPPHSQLPRGARELRPGPGARLLETT